MIERLKDRFPDGLVLGSAKAIVGTLGLTIEWNINYHKSQIRLKDNDRLSIISIKGDLLEIGNYFPHPLIHHKLFKGFEVKIPLSHNN